MAYMKISWQYDRHGTGFPSNLNSQRFGDHILNIQLTSDTDNGMLIAANEEKWLSWDVFEEKAVTSFKGRVVDKTPNGNYLVLCTDPGDACLCYQEPLTPFEQPREFLREEAFFNKAGDIVRSYVLNKWDRFEVSEDNFDGEVEIGAVVSGVKDKKMVIASGEGGDPTPTPTPTTYTAVENPTGNPSVEGWYELDGEGDYVLSTDTEVVTGKTYYVKNN